MLRLGWCQERQQESTELNMHEEAVASAAEERLTLDKLHRRMGHISLDAARKLLKDKMITFGTSLDSDGCWAHLSPQVRVRSSPIYEKKTIH